MRKIKTLNMQLVYQHAVEDADGNLLPVRVEPIPIRQPCPDAFLAAWREFDERRAKLEAEVTEEAIQEAFGGMMAVNGTDAAKAKRPVGTES